MVDRISPHRVKFEAHKFCHRKRTDFVKELLVSLKVIFVLKDQKPVYLYIRQGTAHWVKRTHCLKDRKRYTLGPREFP